MQDRGGGTEITPTAVKSRGVPARAAVIGLAAVLAGLVGLAVVGRGSVPPDRARPTPSGPAVAVESVAPAEATNQYDVMPVSTCATAVMAPPSGIVVRRPQSLLAPPIDVVGEWGGPEARVVADRTYAWTFTSGRLTRIDPRNGTTRRWTFADDPAFGAYDIRAAVGGGVWLVGPTELRWFDGSRFRDVIPEPAESTWGFADMAEAADGTIWAVIFGVGPARWDGDRWTPLCRDGWADDKGGNIAIAPDGTVWVAFDDPGVLAHYGPSGDALSAVTIPGGISYGAPGAVVVDARGVPWLATGDGVLTFDGTWQPAPGAGDQAGALLATGSDGAMWAAMGVTGRRAFTSPAAIVRFLPATIRTWGASEGLPFGEGDNVEVTAFAVAGQQAYLETTGGMYALSGSKGADEETWSRLGPDRAPGPDPFDLGRVAVVSGDDAWVSTGGGGLLWQLDGGTWRQVEIPPIGGSGDQSASGLVALPDGSIAITSPAGSMVRSGTDWTLLDAAPSIALAVGPDHDLYIARGGSDPNSGDTLAERTVLRFHRTKAGGWTHGTISTPTEVTSIDAIAIDPAGGVWIRGLSDGVQALWRRTGTTWSRLPALPGSYQFEGTIAVDRQGVLWGGLSSGVSGDPGVAARYDGRSWSIVGRDDSMRFFGTHDITVLRDGRAWVDADGVGLAMQTGGVASLVLPGSFGAMAVDPEGSIYVIGPSGLYRLH